MKLTHLPSVARWLQSETSAEPEKPNVSDDDLRALETTITHLEEVRSSPEHTDFERNQLGQAIARTHELFRKADLQNRLAHATSSPERVSLQVVDPSQWLDDALTHIGPILERNGIEICCDLQARSPCVLAHENVTLVTTIVLSWLLEFAKHQGRVTLTSTQHDQTLTYHAEATASGTPTGPAFDTESLEILLSWHQGEIHTDVDEHQASVNIELLCPESDLPPNHHAPIASQFASGWRALPYYRFKALNDALDRRTANRSTHSHEEPVAVVAVSNTADRDLVAAALEHYCDTTSVTGNPSEGLPPTLRFDDQALADCGQPPTLRAIDAYVRARLMAAGYKVADEFNENPRSTQFLASIATDMLLSPDCLARDAGTVVVANRARGETIPVPETIELDDWCAERDMWGTTKITPSLGATGALIAGIPSLLEWALASLIENARESDAQSVRVTTSLRNTTVQVVVADDGRGMTPSEIREALQPFATTKDPALHQGVGLNQVRGIVHAHHGTVRMHSVPGDGTEITLSFPRT